MKFGSDALKAAGFPLIVGETFAGDIFNVIKDPSLKAVSVAIRAGQPPNTNKGFEVAPKPMAMKTKTCSDAQGVPVLAGFIAWEQDLFGREHSQEIHKDEFKPVQLKVSLREVLADAEMGKYKVTMNGNQIMFQPLKADDKNKNDVVFSFDLTKGEQKVKLSVGIEEKLRLSEESQPAKPNNWKDAIQGEFADKLDQLFPVSYAVKRGGEVKPLEVAATLDTGRPVTGDADLLWITTPPAIVTDEKLKEYNQEYNLNEKDTKKYRIQLTMLINSFLGIHEMLTKSIFDMDNDVNVDHLYKFAETSGIVTPYELFFAMTANQEFKNQQVVHFENLFQHGPEVRNPGKASPLDGAMLHFYKGLPILTENENELVQFVMSGIDKVISKEEMNACAKAGLSMETLGKISQSENKQEKSYLEDHYIPIHKGWNMAKWWPVVVAQHLLGQPVSTQTMEACNAYMSSRSFKVDQFSGRVKEALTNKLSTQASTTAIMNDLGLNQIKYSDMGYDKKENSAPLSSKSEAPESMPQSSVELDTDTPSTTRKMGK